MPGNGDGSPGSFLDSSPPVRSGYRPRKIRRRPSLQQPFASPQRPLASPQGPLPSPQGPKLPIPPGLPRYDLDARLDIPGRKVFVRERVQFTNRSSAATSVLVFHVYPRYQVKDQDRAILSKTLEILRLSPDEAMDTQGRRLAVTDVRVAGKKARYEFDPNLDTIMIVPLAQAGRAGGDRSRPRSISCVDLPDYWGRWGHHKRRHLPAQLVSDPCAP